MKILVYEIIPILYIYKIIMKLGKSHWTLDCVPFANDYEALVPDTLSL